VKIIGIVLGLSLLIAGVALLVYLTIFGGMDDSYYQYEGYTLLTVQESMSIANASLMSLSFDVLVTVATPDGGSAAYSHYQGRSVEPTIDIGERVLAGKKIRDPSLGFQIGAIMVILGVIVGIISLLLHSQEGRD